MSSPAIAQKGPFLVEVAAGKTYYWCACGLSRNQPFCDGSHKSTALEPLAYKAAQTTTVELCGCKQTSTRPFCDGTHENL
jgi:CDGSH iron-sulfur domain-containing protein 3